MMKGRFLRLIPLIFSLTLSFNGTQAQTKYTISGFAKEEDTGEAIIGAVVYTSDKSAGVSTNEYGFYSLSLPMGKYTILCAGMEYVTDEFEVDLRTNVTHDFLLKEDNMQLEAAKVTSSSHRDALSLPQMGVQTISPAIAKKLPALMGETDIIRVIQMMPGVQTPSEGSTGFSVRGGGIDQNLVLMDGAPVYNSGHFLGFLSMFNSDAIKSTQLYKGDFPAKFGGKTSSVLDINTLDGDLNEYHGNIGVGLLTSKVTLEGPIVKSKASFMFAARRSYLDIFFPLFKEIPKGTKLSFYDINARINWNIGEKDKLAVSAFSSNDLFGLRMMELGVEDMTMDYRNNTQSIRWSHIFSPKLFNNLTVYNSLYDNEIGLSMDEVPFDWYVNLSETGLKDAATWYIDSRNTLEFGLQAAFFSLQPNKTVPRENSIVQGIVAPKSYAIQPSVYASLEQKLGPLTLRYGLRATSFTTMGETDQFYYDEVTHARVDSVHFGKGEEIQSYSGLEPRVSASLRLGDNTSLKAAYSRSYQFIQQAVMSVSGSIADAWFTASPNIKPQISDQISAGVTQNFLSDGLQLTGELFWKNNQNTIDLMDNPGFVIVDPDREGLLRFGRSYAYGAELMLEYEFSKLNGWVSYTYSNAMYDIPEINGGVPYRSPINHKHSFNAIVTYDFNKRISASADWVFYSGAPTTYPAEKYKIGDTYVPVYPGRNEDRQPDYHRLDLSLTIRGRKRTEDQRWSGEWNFSIYNAYDRHNAWSVTTGYNREEKITEARRVYLFAIIPSFSYNLKF